MYARCTIIQGDPDTADQAIKITREQVIPIARELDGFRGLLDFVDRDSGKGMTITLWESEEARAASAERAKQVRTDVTRELKAEVLAVEHYELVVDER